MSTKVEKGLWLIASITLMIVAFYYIPQVQKMFADRIYKKMK